MLLAQSFPITSQNLSQLLALDWLRLGLIVLLAVVIGITLNNYLKGRRELKNADNTTAIIKFLTDEASPMVVANRQTAESNKRVADAVELGNERSKQQVEAMEKQTTALLTLGAKTDEQTVEVKGLRADSNTFQGLMTSDLSKQTESIADLKRSIDTLNENIGTLIKDRQDCLGLREQLSAFRVEFLDKLSQQSKRDTKTVGTVLVPEQTLVTEVSAPKEPGLN